MAIFGEAMSKDYVSRVRAHMPGFTLRSSCNAHHPPGPTHYASRLIRLFIVFLLAASLPACMPAQASNTGSPTALLATPSLGVSPSSTPENPSRPTFTTTASPVIQATPEVTQTLLPVLLATATSPVTVRFAALGDYGQASQP